MARASKAKIAMQEEMAQLKEKIALMEQEKAALAKHDTPAIPLFHVANPKESANDKIAEQKKYDCQMIKGKFLNLRAPGNAVKLPYMKYSTDVEKWWYFQHNKEYEIPRGFADQINDYYAKITYNEKNNPISDPDDPGTCLGDPQRNQIYAFVPIEFK